MAEGFYISDTMQPAPPVEAAKIEWPGFTDGEKTYVTIEAIDDLVEHGEYALIPYYIGGHGDQPTAEPINGTAGPRFSAPSHGARFWEVLDRDSIQ